MIADVGQLLAQARFWRDGCTLPLQPYPEVLDQRRGACLAHGQTHLGGLAADLRLDCVHRRDPAQSFGGDFRTMRVVDLAQLAPGVAPEMLHATSLGICCAHDYVAEWELCRTGHDELAFSPQHNLLHSQRAKEGHQPLVRLPRAIRSGLRGIAKRHRLGLQLDIDPRLARSCLTRYDQHPCRDRPRYEGPGHRSLRCREAGPRRPWKDKPGLTSFLKSL